ncbi:MAG TPA: FGGY-family carbohydrate kinase, partial [Terrimicrobiaceae bacterium]|nr:FGGY-family carbohydrate kinase [Terrimicrobiaceae bacterium]
LTGERTPDLPGGVGVFHGLNLSNFTAAHMARAAYEGVTLGLGYGLARLRQLGVHPSEIRLTGGGSNSKLWRKMCADVFGVPTVCLRSGEGAGLGAAIQAGWVWNKEHGSDATLSEISDRLIQLDESSRNEPDPDATAIYNEALNKTFAIRKTLHEAKLI